MKAIQCRLRLKTGTAYQIAWIPEKFAHVGDKLDLRDKHGDWNGPWTVEDVYRKLPQSMESIREHQRIDLPSIKGGHA
jgi:hypothetical protein